MTPVHNAPAARAVRRTLTAAGAAICTAALFAVASGPALAKKPAPKKPTTPSKPSTTAQAPISPGSTYLALGDSVTFGYEEPNVVPAPNYGDAASFTGYPEMVAGALHLKVVNAACPGETSASLINTSTQSNGCESSPGGGTDNYRTLHPLHVNYTGSQLAFAVSYLKKHHGVRLVSLMIGADDYFVCQETTADKCTSVSEETAVLGQVAKNVHTILSTIRNKAHYTGQLAIVNYYSLNYSSATDDALSQALNNTQDSAARPFHAVIADGYDELGAAAVHSGGNTCTAGLLTQLSSGGCGIHPSYAGQALLAQALEKVIRLS
jgi:lysophospholipase L1-like esterase